MKTWSIGWKLLFIFICPFIFHADISRSGDYDSAYEDVVHWLEATNRKLEINKDVKGSLVAITERLRNVQEISRSVETGKDKYNK